MTTTIATIAVAAVLVVFASLASAGSIPPSHTFPARFHNTPAHAAALAREHAHAAASGYAVNKTANWLTMPLFYEKGKTVAEQPTYDARWFQQNNYFDPKTPRCMLYFSGEGPVHEAPAGYLIDVAKEIGALVVNHNHRWYQPSKEPCPPGKAQGKDCWTNSSFILASLNVSLVMDDANFFTDFIDEYIQQSLGAASKCTWVVVGGSYSGALSAWAKAAFPDKFKWAWSSSGVVNPIFDFTQFDGHIKKVLPFACEQAVRRGFEQMSDMWDTNRAELLETILGGVPAATFLQKADLAWMLADGTAMQVQYGGKTRGLCDTMLDAQKQPYADLANNTNSALLRIRASIEGFWGKTWLTAMDSNCYYSTECLSNDAYWKHWGPAGRSWVTQCCNQFAWWQPGFHNSLRLPVLTTEYFTEQCRTMLKEPTLFPQIYNFNMIHGGLHPKAEKVFAYTGSEDPWLMAEVQQDFPQQNYFRKHVQCTDWSSHCADLQAPDPKECQELKDARKFIMKYAKLWLGISSEEKATSGDL